MTVLMVLLGGAVGAPLRYVADLAIQRRHDSAVPWGTVTVNTVGSFLLGLVAGAVVVAGAPAWLLDLVGIGLCGALTTFSAFSFETVRLLEYGATRAALTNVVLSLLLSFTACAGGWALVAGLV